MLYDNGLHFLPARDVLICRSDFGIESNGVLGVEFGAFFLRLVALKVLLMRCSLVRGSDLVMHQGAGLFDSMSSFLHALGLILIM